MSRRHSLLIIILILLSKPFYLSAQDASSYINPEWTKPYQPFRIAGNLYYVGTYDLACYLIHTSQGEILINTGLAESVPLIRKNIESLGFRFSDVKILLTTQAHFDHVAGMAEIKKLTGSKMYVHAGDVQVLEDGGKSDFIFGGKQTFPPVKADHILQDGDTIKLGDTKLLVLHHPGHTKGSTSFMLDVADDQRTWKVLIVNIPSILPQTRISGMPAYPQVGKDYARTLSSLKKLEFDLWVASHASQFMLHEKRKAGDPYRPKVFADKPGFEAAVNTIAREYEDRLKREKK